MLRLYLIRHAEVEEAWRGRVYGDLDVELSANGKKQSQRFLRRLRDVSFEAVWSSDLQRTQEPAAGLAEARGIPHLVREDLREVFRGGWRERSWEEIEKTWPGAARSFVREPDREPPHGESLLQVSRRARRALKELRVAHPSGAVVLLAHTWIVRSVLCEALGLPLERSDRLAVETASIAVVDYLGNGEARLLQINLRDPQPQPLLPT